MFIKVIASLLLCLHIVLATIEHRNDEQQRIANHAPKEEGWLTDQEDCGTQLLLPDNRLRSCNAPWTYCKGTCMCGNVVYKIIHCNVRDNSTILTCNCITYNEREGLTEIGSCIYNSGPLHKGNVAFTGYTAIPLQVRDLNEVMCGRRFNRNGTLCGKCREGYYPLAYSYNVSCVQCPGQRYHWWTFALAAFLPLTIFYFVVLFFEINITSSHLHGYVFYSQMISSPIMVRAVFSDVTSKPKSEAALKWVVSFYGIWNLDFFRSFDLNICLGTGTLETLALDFIVGAYPLVLMALSYVLIELHDRNFKPLVVTWKPFRILFGLVRKNWEVRTSLIDAFATFFLLSNVKFQSVSFDLLVPVVVYHLSPTGELT